MKRLVIVGSIIVLTLSTANASPVINEIRTDQLAADVDEYFELAGDPGESLTGYWYLVIGDGAGGSGVVETVVDLSGYTLGADGLLSVGEDGEIPCGEIDAVITGVLNFEDSDNVTHLLVEGFSGALDDDLDTDDDGVLDVEPWTAVADCLALIETALSGEHVYCDTQLGPHGAFVPVHAVRCVWGWGVGEFDICTLDSPGGSNTVACGVPEEKHSWGEVKAGYR